MRAADTLARDGLNAFGVSVESANRQLAAFVANHEKGSMEGARALPFALERLLQKMEATHDGRTIGFRLDEDEAKVLDILIANGTHFKVKREGLTMGRDTGAQ